MAKTISPQLSDWYKNQNVDKGSGLLSTAATYQPTTVSDPTKWNVDSSQTVAGQVENVIKDDSPLMQLARTRGLQTANQRGVLNSSLAAGAAQDAVINAALPIAQQDADTNARAAGYNADTENTFAKTNADIENQAKNFGAQAINRANEFNATNTFNKEQDQFQANVQASLDQINNEYEFDKQTQALFGTLSNDFAKQMTSINQDPNMNQGTKDYAIKQLFDVYKAQMSMLSAVGSIPDVSVLLEPEYV